MMGSFNIIELEAVPPFNFDLTLKATPPAFPFIYPDGVLRRAFRLSSGRVIPVKVKSIGSIEDPYVEVSILKSLSKLEEDEVIDKICWFLCLKDDMAEAYRLMDEDYKLKEIKKKLYGVRPWTLATVLEGMVDSVIFQQISLWASFSMIQELVKRLGEKVKVGEEVFYEFPKPEALAKAGLEGLRSCKLSKNKAMYIKGIAERIGKEGFNPEDLKNMATSEAFKVLRGFKGIGVWTAELILATSLKRWEIIPAEDLGVKRALSKFYFNNRALTGREVRSFAERWGDYKWPIAYYLLVASERL